MGCGCGGGRGGSAGLRGVGARPVTTPRRGTIVTPRTLTPSERRQLVAQQTSTVPAFSAQRREVERKRRLAIQQALNR